MGSLRTAVLTLSVAVLASACRHAVPVVDNSPKPANPQGTIAGTVTTPATERPLAGRVVRAINNASGAEFRATTNNSGGFTLMVPPGRYRLDVVLQAGEGLVHPPDAINVGAGDIDSNIALVVGRTGGR
jgi:Carboxypeptidase regulatory-like domain